MNALSQLLFLYGEFSSSQINKILQHTILIQYEKNNILDVNTHIYFLINGLVYRSIKNKNNITYFYYNKTILQLDSWFLAKNSVIFNPYSYTENTKSLATYTTLTESKILAIPYSILEKYLSKKEIIQFLFALESTQMEKYYEDIDDKTIDFQKKNQFICENINNKMIMEYLGITKNKGKS